MLGADSRDQLGRLFWRQDGTRYAASLHYFGAGTTRLLGRLIAELRPANELVPQGRVVVRPAKFAGLPPGWRSFQRNFGLLTPRGAAVESYALSWAYKPGPFGWANSMPRNAIAVNVILIDAKPGPLG